jgi:hypothetical protein
MPNATLLLILHRTENSATSVKGVRHIFAWLGQSRCHNETRDEAGEACLVVAIPCGRYARPSR